MSFAGDAVEVGEPVEDDDERDSWGVPESQYEWTTVTGCRMRPLTARERVELVETGFEAWKLTAPPHAKILAIKPDWVIRFNGIIYEVDGGIEPFTDASGAMFKVTVMCKRQQAAIA